MLARPLLPLVLLALISIVVIISCGGSSGSVPAEKEPQAADPAVADASEAMGYIPSSKAAEHMGEEGTVRGYVKDYQWISGKPGRPFLLLFDVAALVERGSSISEQEIPKTFTVVVWKKDTKNFPATTNFGPGYTGKTVCATGLIEDYEGSPAIVVNNPSQLEIDC
jgi:hypothetical protein